MENQFRVINRTTKKEQIFNSEELQNFFRIEYDEDTHKIKYFNKMSDYAISTYYLKKQYKNIKKKNILKSILQNEIVIGIIAVSFVILTTKIIMQWINI